jgi:hypothetical protein
VMSFVLVVSRHLARTSPAITLAVGDVDVDADRLVARLLPALNLTVFHPPWTEMRGVSWGGSSPSRPSSSRRDPTTGVCRRSRSPRCSRDRSARRARHGW